jgi:hypothetical protein
VRSFMKGNECEVFVKSPKWVSHFISLKLFVVIIR